MCRRGENTINDLEVEIIEIMKSVTLTFICPLFIIYAAIKADAYNLNDSLKERAKESDALFVPDALLDFFETNIIFPANEAIVTGAGTRREQEPDEHLDRDLSEFYDDNNKFQKKSRKCIRYQYWCRRPDKDGRGQYFRRMEVDKLDIPEEGLENVEVIKESNTARMIYEHYKGNYPSHRYSDMKKRKGKHNLTRKHRKYDYSYGGKHRKYGYTRHRNKNRKHHSLDFDYYSDDKYDKSYGKYKSKYRSDSHDDISHKYYGHHDKSSSSDSRDYYGSNDGYHYPDNRHQKKQNTHNRCDRYHQDYCCYMYQAKCTKHEYEYHEATNGHGNNIGKYEHDQKPEKHQKDYNGGKYDTGYVDNEASHNNADISEDFFDYESWANGR